MAKVPTLTEANHELKRALAYLEQCEVEKAPCACGLPTEARGTGLVPDHALDCPAFARVDVERLRACLDELTFHACRMAKVDEALEILNLRGLS